jgi:hypothetical protein
VSWPPTLEAFKQMVAEEWGLEPRQLESKARIQSLVRPRQAAMYLAREVGHYPLAEIGHAFHRDHSTVNHAIQVVYGRLIMDREFKAKVDVVVDQLAEIRHKDSTFVNNRGVGNGQNRYLPTFSTRYPEDVQKPKSGKPKIEPSFGEPGHIFTPPITATKSFNMALDVICSVPDRETRLHLWRAWKTYCQILVRRAIQAGQLTPGPCERCTAVKAQAHHPDYRQPYRVIWLCHPCHQKVEHDLGVPGR